MPAPKRNRNSAHDDTFDVSETAKVNAMAEVIAINPEAKQALRAFVARIENLEREEVELREIKKEVRAEIKGQGFDVKVFNALIKKRKQDAAKLEEFDAILDLYEEAVL